VRNDPTCARCIETLDALVRHKPYPPPRSPAQRAAAEGAAAWHQQRSRQEKRGGAASDDGGPTKFSLDMEQTDDGVLAALVEK
jgi:hypothetical protein